MNFYCDEDVPLGLVQGLRNLGHNALTAQEDGRANQKIPDSALLQRAIALQRAVITKNKWHFKKLHRRHQPHPGIIIFSEDLDYPALAKRIHQAIQPFPSLENELITVDLPQKS